MKGRAIPAVLPQLPTPVQLEIEFTNRCNANCSACPRHEMGDFGLMTATTLDRILTAYKEVRMNHPLNVGREGGRYPQVTIAGGGDPFIHPNAISLIEQCVASDFPPHVITNASRLGAQIDALIDAKPRSINVSFWGINDVEYQAAMRLPFGQTLDIVERLAEAAAGAGIPFVILWVDVPEIRSSRREIEHFWARRGIEVDMSDNHMWNRAGLMPMPRDLVVDSAVVVPPDFEREIWCSDLYFSDTYRWNGDAILCCCNYFAGRPHVLGNIADTSPAAVSTTKGSVLVSPPAMCRSCALPRQVRAEWLAGPWLKHLGEKERASLLYKGRGAGQA